MTISFTLCVFGSSFFMTCAKFSKQMLDLAILCFHLVRYVEQIFCQRQICERYAGIHSVVSGCPVGAVYQCLHKVANRQIEGFAVQMFRWRIVPVKKWLTAMSRLLF